MVRKKVKFNILFLCFAILINTFSAFPAMALDEKTEENYFNAQKQNNVKLVENIDDYTINPSELKLNPGSSKATLIPASESKGYEEPILSIKGKSKIEFDVDVKAAGGYNIALDYFLPETSMEDLNISLLINGEYQFYESRNIKLPASWKDSTQDYKEDDFKNQLFPSPVRIYKWQSKALNSTIYNLKVPFIFNLKKGINTITIQNNDIAFYLGKIKLVGSKKTIDYSEYSKQYTGAEPAKDQYIEIEGEKYSEKSESYIRGSKGNNQNAFPYDPVKKKIQALDESMWENPGEGVSYKVNISKDGFYYIGFKFTQDVKKDMPVFKNIYLDGKILFDEMSGYMFNYTGMKYQNNVLGNKEQKYMFYLKKGEHTLTIESTASKLYNANENLLYVINKLNNIALEIKFITGDKTDKNRDWGIDEFIPDIKKDLLQCASIIDNEYKELNSIVNRTNMPEVADLKVAEEKLIKFSGNLNFMVNNLDQLSQGSGSATDLISLILPELLKQPMGIDKIYITGDYSKIPPANSGFLKNLYEGTRKLLASFFERYDKNESKDETKLNIWVNRPMTHIDILREMINEEFEPNEHIKVNISAMPDEQKLLLAVASGRAPDAVLGASSYRPFDFALRGALYDLRQFDDFGKVIDSFNPEMFVPYIIGDSCYAVPETANFNVLFYRKDILNKLNLNVPRTWDDVIAMLPTLSRYGMSFNTLIANVGGLKHFGTTVPFIQQYNGKVYSEDGSKVELGDPNTVKAFKLMTNLYTRYSLPENIQNFYDSFKRGVIPIGMSDMNTYILLKHTAPELEGQWGIAPAIGVKDQTGKILNYYPSVNTACIIMKNSKKPEDAWKFIKWWMSDNVQTSYANDMQLRYGPEYIWNTANLKALENSTAYSEDDKKVILQQLNNTKEIPRNPAYFSVERELSNAWNKVVFNGVAPRTALDQAIIISNREIQKKLKEFGYMDSNGKLIKPFEMATAKKVLSWKEH
ncbi:MAG: extracellular solute-binding protein [Clostridiales bacterium]|nr:extracellular solute-binding protein [Clostridiales bacterium]